MDKQNNQSQSNQQGGQSKATPSKEKKILGMKPLYFYLILTGVLMLIGGLVYLFFGKKKEASQSLQSLAPTSSSIYQPSYNG